MDTKGFQLIPADVIKAWSRGEYYVGDIPSISYRHLGIALLLRGWYVYADSDTNSREHWAGVAKVDIRGSTLSMGGIRLFGTDRTFWTTEHSHIRDDEEIVWFYSGFHCKPDDATFLKYVPSGTNLDRSLPDSFGMNKDAWENLLGKLATDFDDDIARMRRSYEQEAELEKKKETEQPADLESDQQTGHLIDHGMLRFSVELDKNCAGKEKSRSCRYSHYECGSENATTGFSKFTKILFGEAS